MAIARDIDMAIAIAIDIDIDISIDRERDSRASEQKCSLGEVRLGVKTHLLPMPLSVAPH